MRPEGRAMRPDRLLQLLILLAAAEAAVQPPRFELHPADAAAPAGAPLRLVCAASGGSSSQRLRIVWHNADTGLPVADSGGSTLEFARFNASLAGRYYCNASIVGAAGAGSWAISRPAWARLAHLGRKFASDPVSRAVTAGGVAELSCRPPLGADPLPRIVWHRNGRPLRIDDRPEEGRFQTLHDVSGGGVKLRIVSARPSDSGEYACVASNEAGELNSASAVLTVVRKLAGSEPIDQPIRVLVLPLDADSAIGDSVALQCRVDGPITTAASFTWRRDDGAAMDPTRVSDYGNGTLGLRNVAEGDAGKYVCEVTSPLGRAAAIATLSVQTRPVIIEAPADQAVSLGGRAVFACRAGGSPPPSIFWSTKSNNYLFHGVAANSDSGNSDDDTAGMVVGQDGTLTVSPVRLRHQGRYQCHASSELGTAVASATLSVIPEPPPAVPTSPILSLGPQSQTVMRGRTLVLPCRMEASQFAAHRLRVIWLKDGRQLDSTAVDKSRQHVGLDGSLSLFEVRPADSGNYSCRAELDGRPAARWPLPARIRVINIGGAESQSVASGSSSETPQLPMTPMSVGVVDRAPGWVLLNIIGGGSGSGCRRLVEWDCGAGWTTSFSWERLAESSLVRLDTGAGGIGLTTAPTDCRFLARSVCQMAVPPGSIGADSLAVSRPSPASPIVRLEPPYSEASEPTSAATDRAASMIADWQAEVVESASIHIRWWLLRPPTSRIRVRAAGRQVRLADCLARSSATVTPNSYCSLAQTDALAELLRFDAASIPPNDSDDVVATADAVNGQSAGSLRLTELAAFTCYRVSLTATIGRDVSGGGVSRLVLTGDASPSLAPIAVSTRWHSNGSLGVSWLPPPMAGRRGAITGFQLRLLDLRRQSDDVVRSIQIDQARARSVLIAGPLPTSPAASLVVRLSARNCRGAGPESPELAVPFFDSSNDSATMALLPQASWLVVASAVGGAIWLGLAVIVACALRRVWLIRKRRRLRRRQPPMSPPAAHPQPPLLDCKLPPASIPALPHLQPPPPPPPLPPPRTTAGPGCRPPPDLLVATSTAVAAGTSASGGASSTASPYATASVVHSFIRDSGVEEFAEPNQQTVARQQPSKLLCAENSRLNCLLQQRPQEFHMPQSSCHSLRADVGTICDGAIECSDDDCDDDEEGEADDDIDDQADDADVDDVASVAAGNGEKRRRPPRLLQQHPLYQHQQHQRRPLMTGADSPPEQSCSTVDGCSCCQDLNYFKRDGRRRRRKVRRQKDRPLPLPPLPPPPQAPPLPPSVSVSASTAVNLPAR